VEVDFGKLENQIVKPVGFIELLDLLIEGEVFEQGADFEEKP